MTEIVIKSTNISYCSECRKDFADNETCWFTWYENACFCHDCKKIMNERASESYLDWKLRIYKK